MGSAARFSALLVAGVTIVVLYVRSGESPVVLVLSLVTLLVGLYLWEVKPWSPADDEPAERIRDEPWERAARDEPSERIRDEAREGAARERSRPLEARDDAEPSPGVASGAARGDTWRCDHDLIWDERGIDAVAVGTDAPRRVVWSRVDAVALGRHRPGGGNHSGIGPRAIRLGVYRPAGRSGPPSMWLCLGPDQDPERVAADLKAAWREVRARRSYPGSDPVPDREADPGDPGDPGEPDHRGDPR